MESANYNINDYNNILNACIGIFNTLNLGKIIYLELISEDNKSMKIEIKNNQNKSYYFITDEFGGVVQAREDTLDGKIIYSPSDDYNDNGNTISHLNKDIYTLDQQPWIEYLEIDEATGERKLRADTPEEIVKKYNEFNNSKLPNNIRTSDYILISSTGYFSKKKINNCFVSLIENKIYNYTYDSDNNDKYDYLKDLTSNQKDKLMKYINDNDLLNVNINNVVFDASDIIEINISGKKNVIRNASKEFTNNEMHIFDDIVDIVFNDSNNPLEKIKNFFNIDLKNDKEITKFAQEHGYKGAKYIGNWKEYKVYEPYVSGNDISFTGLPLVILVNDKGEIRMSTSDEAIATLDDKSFIESFEETKNVNETKLIRENLINLINNFKDERNKYNNTNIPNDLYLKYLEKIESILNSYNDDIDDNRFVNKTIVNNGWISNDDAINYLFDSIIGNITILPTDVPQGQNLSNISTELNQYYKDGYVCSKEKEMLLNIINEIKKYIHSSNNDGFIRKYKIDENGHEYEETKKIELEKCPNCNETLLIMGANKGILTCPKCKTNYMSLDGKIYPTDKMSTQDINALINDIDNKIAELEVEKNKIDKDIENNFEEVSKYSILNKTLEELLDAKKRFISDWDVLLFNTTSDHWIMNSSTYRVHLVSIIDAILRRIDDSISKQQLELLNSITENKYLGNKYKDSVVKIVKQLKELESK